MANKVNQVIETAITWLASGGTAVLTLTSLAAGAGRQGAFHDLGATARSPRYTWRFWMKFASAPAVGEVIEIYLKTADASNAHPDNDDGTGDAAVSAEDKLRNLMLLGTLVIDEASSTPEFAVGGGPVEIAQQCVAPVIWNRSAGDAFSGTAGDHGFSLSPVPYEIA